MVFVQSRCSGLDQVAWLLSACAVYCNVVCNHIPLKPKHRAKLFTKILQDNNNSTFDLLMKVVSAKAVKH